MLKKTKGLSHFWREVKRRNVHRSLAIYAGTAFIILEAVSLIFPRWGLPDWSIDLVLYLLIIGAFINIIISWIYDITPKGVQKTTALEDTRTEDKATDSKKWEAATYVSLVVIAGLIIFNILPNKKMNAGVIQSLVVLPFDNFTGDDGLEYFVSGMHASLIGDMGKVGGLRVISKTSSNTYKDVDMSIPDIATELKVDAVVETQVMCLGDSICLQVRIVSPFPEEKLLWVADYREEKSQILNLYNRVTRQIANEVSIELSPDEERILTQPRTVNKEAYDAYLMGLYYWDKLGKDPLEKALEYFSVAIEIDPDWAPAYSGIAQVWAGLAQMGFVLPEVAGPIIFENLNKSLELDPEFAASHYTQGMIGTWIEWNWIKGEKEFLKALSINPNDAMSRIFYAHLLMHLQRKAAALAQGQLAIDLDPLNPLILGLYGVVLAYGDRWEEAHEHVEKAISLDPFNYFAHLVLEPVAYHLGDINGLLKSARVIFPFEDSIHLSIEKIATEQGIKAAYQEIIFQLEALGQSSFLAPFPMANRYSDLHQYDKVLDLLEMAYEIRDQNLPYIACGYGSHDSLYNHPRFIALMEKLDLPFPAD